MKITTSLVGSRIRGTRTGVAPVVPPTPTDMQAPAFPTGAAGANGSSSVTFTCDPTADMHDGVTAAGGVASYVLNVNGTNQSPVAVNGSTILANIRTQPTLFQLGSFSPAPTLAQSGRVFTMASKGTGADSTADQLGFAGWEVTGDFDLYVKLSTITGTGSIYSPGGLMWREATAATVAATTGAKYGSIYRFLSANSSGLQAKQRLTASTAPTAYTSNTGSNSPRWLRIRKRRTSSTDIFTYQYSADGGGWTTLYTSTSLSGLSNTLVIGWFTSDLQNLGDPSAVTTVVGDGLQYTAGAQALISKTFTTSTTVSGYWKAIDLAGNVSAQSPAVTANGTPSVAVKMNFGWYVWYVPDTATGSRYRIDLSGQLADILAFIDSIQYQTAIKGIQIIADWKALEGDTATDYSAGFASIDAILARLALYDKHLMLCFSPTHFGGWGGGYSTIWPQYLVTAQGIVDFDVAHAPGGTAKFWEAGTMDPYIRVCAAYLGRYDSHANFEMLTAPELAISAIAGSGSTYTDSAALTQWQRWIPAARTAGPHTALRICANDLSGGATPDKNMRDIFATGDANYVMFGGPDIWLGDITQADRVYQARDATGTNMIPSGWVDYRDRDGWVSEAQSQSYRAVGADTGTPRYSLATLFGAVNGYVPGNAQFGSGVAIGAFKPRYIISYRNTFYGNSTNQWSAIQAFMAANPNLHTSTKPTQYP